jgi:uncharacterized glyoxalase superfamily protein PhnB
MLKSLTPNLMVPDVNQSLNFYTNLLGFEVLQSVPDSGILQWAFIQSGDVRLMLQKETSIKEEYPELEKHTGGGALTFYIHAEALEGWYEKLKDKVNVIKPLHKTFYGANEFSITDPDGFILTFSEAD